MGLIVDEIIDIVEGHLNVELTGRRPVILGAAVIDGRATESVDAGYFASLAQAGQCAGCREPLGFGSGHKSVLRVDDSPFFRNLLTPLLSVAGYDVTAVDSAAAALSRLEDGGEFDVIISDIEMPGMNGYEFAKAIRDDRRWQETPLVALSSHATPADLDRGRNAG